MNFLKRFRWSIFYVFPSFVLLNMGASSWWDPTYRTILNLDFFTSYIFFSLMCIGYFFWSFIYFLQEIILGKEYLISTMRSNSGNPNRDEEKAAKIVFNLYKLFLSMIFAFAFSSIVSNRMTSLW